MSYATDRDARHLSQLNHAIDQFKASDYHPGWKLIFLFPGGVGSQLLRASTWPFPYYVSWVDPGRLLVGEPNNLKIETDDRDHQGQYIIPDHEVGVLLPLLRLSPYGGFRAWCRDNKFNLFVFGWDWRRGVKHSADFFLGKALPAFVAKGIALNDFVLIGHSAGGMVVKVIANQTADPYVQQMDKAITVAAPFYGISAQIQKFIAGMSVLNWSVSTPGNLGARQMARICASMLGGYEFMYLDEATYNSGTNAADFKANTEPYKLLHYPSVDFSDGTVADPFNPTNAGGMFRYPANNGIRPDLMAAAIPGVQMVAQDLDATVAQRFYCIRGIQGKAAVLNNTPVSITWKRVPAGYDADTSPSSNDYPIDEINGPGDGFLAAWGTRLLRLPAGHVIDVHDNVEHELMMNMRSVQKEIGLLLGLAEGSIAYPTWVEPVFASLGELGSFLSGVRENITDKFASPAQRLAAFREYLAPFTFGQLQALYNRAVVDLPKSPKQLAALYPASAKKG
jgi:pimeloyl-ACP methyl ester carboxylesterase